MHPLFLFSTNIILHFNFLFIFPKTHVVILLGERVRVFLGVEFEHLEAAVEIRKRDIDPLLEAPEKKSINSEK